MTGLTHQQTEELCRHLRCVFAGPEHGAVRVSDVEASTVRAVELLESAGYKTSDGYVVEYLRKQYGRPQQTKS